MIVLLVRKGEKESEDAIKKLREINEEFLIVDIIDYPYVYNDFGTSYTPTLFVNQISIPGLKLIEAYCKYRRNK